MGEVSGDANKPLENFVRWLYIEIFLLVIKAAKAKQNKYINNINKTSNVH